MDVLPETDKAWIWPSNTWAILCSFLPSGLDSLFYLAYQYLPLFPCVSSFLFPAWPSLTSNSGFLYQDSLIDSYPLATWYSGNTQFWEVAMKVTIPWEWNLENPYLDCEQWCCELRLWICGRLISVVRWGESLGFESRRKRMGKEEGGDVWPSFKNGKEKLEAVLIALYKKLSSLLYRSSKWASSPYEFVAYY